MLCTGLGTVYIVHDRASRCRFCQCFAALVGRREPALWALFARKYINFAKLTT